MPALRSRRRANSPLPRLDLTAQAPADPMVVTRATAADSDRRSERNTRSIIRRMPARMIPAEKFGITNKRLHGPHRVVL